MIINLPCLQTISSSIPTTSRGILAVMQSPNSHVVGTLLEEEKSVMTFQNRVRGNVPYKGPLQNEIRRCLDSVLISLSPLLFSVTAHCFPSHPPPNIQILVFRLLMRIS